MITILGSSGCRRWCIDSFGIHLERVKKFGAGGSAIDDTREATRDDVTFQPLDAQNLEQSLKICKLCVPKP